MLIFLRGCLRQCQNVIFHISIHSQNFLLRIFTFTFINLADSFIQSDVHFLKQNPIQAVELMLNIIKLVFDDELSFMGIHLKLGK